MNKTGQVPALDRPATYEIRVPVQIGADWSDWVEGLTVTVEQEGRDRPISTLIGRFDQAALLGLLRRFYSLGVPLISVNCIDDGQAESGARAPGTGTA